MIRKNLHTNWTMKDKSWDSYIPAFVPGDLYSDLLKNEKTEDPYYRDNELEALKLSEKEYEYVCTFEAEAAMLSEERVLLRFEGIDTLAEVFVNGVCVGTADNMHRIWEYDVKRYITVGKNEVKIEFHSPTKYIREKYAAHRLDGTSDAMRGFPYLRKAHCMFGWDWGPRLPGVGLWRDVSLVAYSTARIDSTYITQEVINNAFFLDTRVELVSSDGHGFVFGKEGQLVVKADSRLTGLSVLVEVFDPVGALVAKGNGTDRILIEYPQLWWPAGLGEQPLYTVKVSLYDKSTLLDTWERRIGLRTMTMSTEKDEYGERFAHKVNGVEFFAMGADYIPEDNLLARTSKERTRQLLTDAKLANFNCIRVWGGGYYPEDWFYDICDELGLVVWQDFMFACAVYDLTEAFEENIIAEFKDNIKRLRHHASLGLWCGNNEMELFVKQGEWVNSPKEQSDYVKMYEYILPKVLKEYDPATFYWPASPSSGGCFDEPNDETRGDVHYWEVWHGNKPITEYRKFHFRYLSEFGFQSFPSVKTIETFTLPEDRNIYSYVMEKHQRNAAANGKISNYMSQTYLYPTSFDTVVYASQLLQAQAIRYGVEHFRRWRGRCMGTVIWQLNDCWPVASWSSIDYYGRWKALHYYAKRFFAPVLLSCEEEGILTQDTNPNAEPYEVIKSVRFNVSNETPETKKVLVEWNLCNPKGEVLWAQPGVTVEAEPLSAVWLDKVELPQANLQEDHVFYTLLTENGDFISEGSVLFCQPKYYKFVNPELSLKLEGDEIVVTAKAYAKDVEILNENEDLVLSDNYFDMEPGEHRVKILRGKTNGLRVRSTYDIR
ncbi:MAG: glycoside hydrolase family 2 protein [Lachnospiraceae bacterium]|nr:glycoside hydrolase family 2 protein [Lachnospiraceae bacterium]